VRQIDMPRPKFRSEILVVKDDLAMAENLHGDGKRAPGSRACGSVQGASTHGLGFRRFRGHYAVFRRNPSMAA
jgi:hypothetical protein